MEDEYLKRENKKRRKETECFMTEFESLKGREFQKCKTLVQ